MKLFKEKTDLLMSYKVSYQNKDIIPYLTYSIENEKTSIDAKSKELINHEYDGMKRWHINLKYYSYSDATKLSNEEKDNIIKNLKDIINEKEAESIVRNFGDLGENYELTSSELSRNKDRELYVWNLGFNRTDNNNGHITSATINAKTKEIARYHKDEFSEMKGEIKYNEKQLVEKGKEFIKRVYPEKFKKIYYVEEVGNKINKDKSYGETVSSPYQIIFGRKENGMDFTGSGISIDMNPVTGEVIGYATSWHDISEFPTKKEIIPKEEVFDTLLNSYDLELRYILLSNDTKNKNNKDDKEKIAKLVYGLNYHNNKKVNINAKTGNIIGGNIEN